MVPVQSRAVLSVAASAAAEIGFVFPHLESQLQLS
jgi:hypothetical protein